MNLFRNCILTVFMATVVATVLTASAAIADSSVRKSYVTLGAGINQPTGDMDDAGYDTGSNISAAYGRYLGKHLVIEGAIHFFGTDQELSGNTTTAGTYTRKDNIAVAAILGTLKGEVPVGPVTLVGGAGFGAYFLTLVSKIETTSLGDYDVSEDDSVFGIHIIGGGRYDINKRFFINLEAMYRWTDDINIERTAATVPVNLKGDLNGCAITVSAGFRF